MRFCSGWSLVCALGGERGLAGGRFCLGDETSSVSSACRAWLLEWRVWKTPKEAAVLTGQSRSRLRRGWAGLGLRQGSARSLGRQQLGRPLLALSLVVPGLCHLLPVQGCALSTSIWGF